uniref:Uncharacterized protein n=1 Tax=Chromera velia CCMP2878 TaxID=1169474 RepID=A0A0G4IF33_9ALVE|eukprot:Cvel_13791.t1-p1 / transcript=Cvel_13791.t1 / gene=Cvel_13791 / organism=Chromera_velia_CCMP2878 / gene_product=hypothetical protein / transcript_product=hypothetical protein / location=Cvel_scaffold956:8798-14101(-) / protein_length=1169 / sequence_SO=supercontig / SO=protein_coding / is_pseudo=false
MMGSKKNGGADDLTASVQRFLELVRAVLAYFDVFEALTAAEQELEDERKASAKRKPGGGQHWQHAPPQPSFSNSKSRETLGGGPLSRSQRKGEGESQQGGGSSSPLGLSNAPPGLTNSSNALLSPTSPTGAVPEGKFPHVEGEAEETVGEGRPGSPSPPSVKAGEGGTGSREKPQTPPAPSQHQQESNGTAGDEESKGGTETGGEREERKSTPPQQPQSPSVSPHGDNEKEKQKEKEKDDESEEDEEDQEEQNGKEEKENAAQHSTSNDAAEALKLTGDQEDSTGPAAELNSAPLQGGEGGQTAEGDAGKEGGDQSGENLLGQGDGEGNEEEVAAEKESITSSSPLNPMLIFQKALEIRKRDIARAYILLLSGRVFGGGAEKQESPQAASGGGGGGSSSHASSIGGGRLLSPKKGQTASLASPNGPPPSGQALFEAGFHLLSRIVQTVFARSPHLPAVDLELHRLLRTDAFNYARRSFEAQKQREAEELARELKAAEAMRGSDRRRMGGGAVGDRSGGDAGDSGEKDGGRGDEDGGAVAGGEDEVETGGLASGSAAAGAGGKGSGGAVGGKEGRGRGREATQQLCIQIMERAARRRAAGHRGQAGALENSGQVMGSRSPVLSAVFPTGFEKAEALEKKRRTLLKRAVQKKAVFQSGAEGGALHLFDTQPGTNFPDRPHSAPPPSFYQFQQRRKSTLLSPSANAGRPVSPGGGPAKVARALIFAQALDRAVMMREGRTHRDNQLGDEESSLPPSHAISEQQQQKPPNSPSAAAFLGMLPQALRELIGEEAVVCAEGDTGECVAETDGGENCVAETGGKEKQLLEGDEGVIKGEEGEEKIDLQGGHCQSTRKDLTDHAAGGGDKQTDSNIENSSGEDIEDIFDQVADQDVELLQSKAKEFLPRWMTLQRLQREVGPQRAIYSGFQNSVFLVKGGDRDPREKAIASLRQNPSPLPPVRQTDHANKSAATKANKTPPMSLLHGVISPSSTAAFVSSPERGAPPKNASGLFAKSLGGKGKQSPRAVPSVTQTPHSKQWHPTPLGGPASRPVSPEMHRRGRGGSSSLFSSAHTNQNQNPPRLSERMANLPSLNSPPHMRDSVLRMHLRSTTQKAAMQPGVFASGGTPRGDEQSHQESQKQTDMPPAPRPVAPQTYKLQGSGPLLVLENDTGTSPE